jgi:cytochrome c556
MLKMINNVSTRLFFLAGIFTVLGLSGCGEKRVAVPADPVERAIFERQHNFKAMGREMKVIDDELKTRKPDLQRVTTAAEKLMATGAK